MFSPFPSIGTSVEKDIKEIKFVEQVKLDLLSCGHESTIIKQILRSGRNPEIYEGTLATCLTHASQTSMKTLS